MSVKELGQALKYANLAKNGYEKLVEKDHYEIAHHVENIARISVHLGKFEEGVENGKSLLQYRLKHFPHDQYNVVASYQILGEACYLSKDFDQAIEVFTLQYSTYYGATYHSEAYYEISELWGRDLSTLIQDMRICQSINIRETCLTANTMKKKTAFSFEEWKQKERQRIHKILACSSNNFSDLDP